jgi:hypothetical protein
MTEFTKTDLTRLETLMAVVKRGKYDLSGDEILAVAQSCSWAAQLHEKIKAQLEASPVEVVKTKPKAKGEVQK